VGFTDLPASRFVKLNTAPESVKNSEYPCPRERNLTRESTCPRFASKLSGSFPYSAGTRGEAAAPGATAWARAAREPTASIQSAKQKEDFMRTPGGQGWRLEGWRIEKQNQPGSKLGGWLSWKKQRSQVSPELGKSTIARHRNPASDSGFTAMQ
jgi:hypothetical protein